jgi:SAM-dependent methyltransferase
MKLNLGCGRDIRLGYINLDMLPLEGVDVVHDLNVPPLPFKEDLFDEINCQNIIEHLDNFLPFMEDVWRILRHGGLINILTAHCSGPQAFSDPTHRSFFSYNSFRYFTRDYTFNFYSKVRFEIVERKIIFTTGRLRFLNPLMNPMLNLFPNLYERLFMWKIPSEAISFTLKALKE